MRKKTYNLLLILVLWQATSATFVHAIEQNGNGMSDVWEWKYHFITTGLGSAAGDDPDGDGFTNLQESIAGTDPYDPKDFPRITAIDVDATYHNGAIGLTWRSAQGVYYLIEESHDLINWEASTRIGDDPNLIGGVGDTTTAYVTHFPTSRQFYRVTASQNVINSDGGLLLDWEEYMFGSNPALVDTDGDGMPDDWEFIHGLDPNHDDSDGDPDNDGVTNLQEYVNGTDPNNKDGITGDRFLFHTAGVGFWTNDFEQGQRYYPPDCQYTIKTFRPYGLPYPGEPDYRYYYGFSEHVAVCTLAGRQSDGVFIQSLLDTYMTDFQSFFTDPSSNQLRWQTANDALWGTKGYWRRGLSPELSAQDLVLADATRLSIIQIVSAQLDSKAIESRTMTYPILIADYALNTDGSAGPDGQGTPTSPTFYSGSFTFTFAVGKRYPSQCDINPGNLPSDIVSTFTIVPPIGAAPSRTAAKIVLAPTGPNMMRTLLPIEIVNKDKDLVTELKVADMEQSLDANEALQIDNDPDRFYVRIGGLSDVQSVSIKLQTVDNPDPSYNDDATEIDLTSTGGPFESKSLLLVSGDVDDKFTGDYDIVGDDLKNDRTHKVQLGGSVKISAVIIDGIEYAIDMRVPVPVKKTVTINAVIMTDAGSPDVAAEVKMANELYASAGVKIVLGSTVTVAPPPPLPNGDTGSTVKDSDIADRGRYISHYGTTPNITDIHVFYVNQCRSGSDVAVQGFSITEYTIGSVDGTTTAEQTGDANNIFISELHAPFRVLGHELGHVLTNAGHYGDDFNSHDYAANASTTKKKHNLMRNGGSQSNTDQIGASKHLYELQREMIWDHSTLAK